MATEALTSDELIRNLEPNLTQYWRLMQAAVDRRDQAGFIRAYEDFCTTADGIGQALSVFGSELFPFHAYVVPSIETESQPCAGHSGPIEVFSAVQWAAGSALHTLHRLNRLPVYTELAGDNG